jgi:hypothetical protein
MNTIDLIIDYLDSIHVVTFASQGWAGVESLNKALAAARELKALQPVAWLTVEGHETTSAKVVISISMQKQINGTPLYALDEVTE